MLARRFQDLPDMGLKFDMQDQELQPYLNEMLPCPRPATERRMKPHPNQLVKCPRCDSSNTKFCYYNNYSLTQPRHFCKTCRRYWTSGGALRNVPVGGGCRKNKRTKQKNPEQRAQAPPISDKSSTVPVPPTFSSENSSVTNASTLSGSDGSPCTPPTQNILGGFSNSGHFNLGVDGAALPLPFEVTNGTMQHIFRLGDSSGLSSNPPVFLPGEACNFSQFLSNSSFDGLDPGLMGFNFTGPASFVKMEPGLLGSSHQDHRQLEEMPQSMTGASSCVDVSNMSGVHNAGLDFLNLASLGYQRRMQQKPGEHHHELGEFGQLLRQEDPLVAENFRHFKGGQAPPSDQDANSGMKGAFDWQLPLEGLFEVPGDLSYIPGGSWSDLAHYGPSS